MAIIPSNTQFVGDTTGIPIKQLRSAKVNAMSEPFTMQDIIDTVGGGGGLAGTQYVYVAADGTDTANAAELQAAYSTAQTMSPSASNIITIIAAPGNYNFSSNFVLSTQYINLVSLDGNRSITFNGTASISIPSLTGNIFVKGVAVLNSSFLVGAFNSNIIIENCSGSNGSFGGAGFDVSTYIDCVGSNDCFSSNGTAGGTYINCVGGDNSFGASSIASGTFTNCTGGDNSFGSGFGSTASGIFTNCVGGYMAFGDSATGTFIDCTGGEESFGGGGNAYGTFINCTGGSYSFGSFNTAPGTFINCTGGEESFGSYGDADGTFINCTGGSYSFGGNNALTGKLYYCRLTTGTFQTVSGAGRTVLCIDGSNNQNNQ